MTRAVCPGSFDPVTRGHLDVIGRAAGLFDEVVVAVGRNAGKRGLFGVEDRLAMVSESCAGWDNVRVAAFDGLLVDFCVQQGAGCIVKGVRSSADVEYELPMARMNTHLTGVETVFLPAAPEWASVSSSLVREVASLGGDVSAFLPDTVADRLATRLVESAAERGPAPG